MRVLLLWIACGTGLWAQQMEAEVYDRMTGAPLAGARASVQPVMNAEGVTAVSDAYGKIHMTFSSPGFNSVRITRRGYLGRDLPRSVAGATNLRIALTPQAVISGKIEDEDGFPVEGVDFRAMHLTAANDRGQLQFVRSARTDDMGRFRLSGLPAGKFFLRLMPLGASASNWDPRYSPQYFPGKLNAGEAVQVEVKAGQEINGFNIRLARFEGVTVTGRLVAPSGVALPQLISIALRSEEPSSMWNYSHASLRPDGSFTLTHIQPGNYTIELYRTNPASGDLAAFTPLTVGASDVPGMTLQARVSQPFDVKGKVLVEGGGAPPRTEVFLQGLNGQRQSAQTGADGSFIVKGVLPGNYRVSVWAGPTFGPSGRMGESLLLDGSSAPLEIRLIKQDGVLPIQLLDAGGQPVVGGVVRLLGSWWGSTDATGSAKVYVAPGEYRVYAAASSDDMPMLDDPEYLKAHQNDYPPVRVAAGTNPVLVLRLTTR